MFCFFHNEDTGFGVLNGGTCKGTEVEGKSVSLQARCVAGPKGHGRLEVGRLNCLCEAPADCNTPP